MNTTYRQQAQVIIRQTAMVLHKFQHRVTGMVMSAYTNPNPQLWVEIA
jgi:hypothetical protein